MRRRWRGLCSLAILAMAVGTVPGLARAAGEPGQPPSADPVRTLRIYYQAPVLVRAGEPVIMPVQVVCVTARGNPCDAILSLGVRSGAGDPWRFHRVEAAPELSFDLTAAAERAGASASVQGVDSSGGEKREGSPHPFRLPMPDHLSGSTPPETSDPSGCRPFPTGG
jgi:hypothetical protein